MIQTMSAAQQIAPDDPQSASFTDSSQSNQSSGSNSSASNTQSDQTSVLDDSASVDQQSDIEQAIASSMKAGPYPTMRQSTLIPLDEIPTQPVTEAPPVPDTTPQTSLDSVSPAIIDLAKNHRDFSIQTIQRVANEIEQREKKAKKMEDEVVISLH